MNTHNGGLGRFCAFFESWPFAFTCAAVVSLLPSAELQAQAQVSQAQPVDPGNKLTEPASLVPPQPALLSNETVALQPPKPTRNEVSVSGDVMFGQGTVTLPLGYSLNKSLGGLAPKILGAFPVPRNSVYYGGTVSYSYGQAWYIDISVAEGQSSGTQSIPTGFLGDLNSSFSINETTYQAYIKYAFPQLRGKRFSAYLRAGASYVEADLQDHTTPPALNRYTQKDTSQDILGNLGFGLGYSLYSTRHLRLDMQFEGEGFYGSRSQVSLESLSGVSGVNFVPANIDNTLFGGIGRATVRLEYRLGHSGLFKIFGEVGAEGRYTLINYPGFGTPNELLWGPYAKLGLRYAF